MNRLNNKKGISLIVLVITIIVMIILAAAIILSLSSSGIIGRANEAKTSSDISNKKQAAQVALAEYELDKNSGVNVPDVTEYVQLKLREQGLNSDDIAITSDSEILVGLSKSAVEAVKADMELGTIIINYNDYLTQKTSTPTDGKEVSGTSGGVEIVGTSQTLTTDVNMVWRYIGIGENGNILIAPDIPEEENLPDTSWLKLGYQGGYLYGVDVLNTICKELYSSSKGIARSMNLKDVIKILKYEGFVGRYTDNEGKAVNITQSLTLAQISKKLGGVKLQYTKTPDGKDSWEDISKHEATFLPVAKVSSHINNSAGIDLVYYSKRYWLSTTGLQADFKSGTAKFGLSYVTNSTTPIRPLFKSDDNNREDECLIRPVVEINANIEFEYNKTEKTCTLK